MTTFATQPLKRLVNRFTATGKRTAVAITPRGQDLPSLNCSSRSERTGDANPRPFSTPSHTGDTRLDDGGVRSLPFGHYSHAA
jgi:hypothetical protein